MGSVKPRRFSSSTVSRCLRRFSAASRSSRAVLWLSLIHISFTGADRRGKPGKFELADKGTIFLDEIGDMPIYLQAKLLRVLQEHSITRIGGLKEKKVDIRIIAATNRNLEKMVEENRFRGDLYYRLNVIPIYVPPLRERKDDIPLLIEFFLGKYRQKLDKHIFGVTGDVRSVLMDYSWPGNIRELENVIEYAMNMEPGNILTMQSLPDDIKSASGGKKQDDRSLKSLMREREREILREKLRQYGDSLEAKKKIADSLGIGIATLYRKLHETSLD